MTVHRLVGRRAAIRVNGLYRWPVYKRELFSSLLLKVTETCSVQLLSKLERMWKR